jgi:hypothetical protein
MITFISDALYVPGEWYFDVFFEMNQEIKVLLVLSVREGMYRIFVVIPPRRVDENSRAAKEMYFSFVVFLHFLLKNRNSD